MQASENFLLTGIQSLFCFIAVVVCSIICRFDRQAGKQQDSGYEGAKGALGSLLMAVPTPTQPTLAGVTLAWVTQPEQTLSKTDSSSTAMSRFFTRFSQIRPELLQDSHRPEAFNRIKFRSRCILSTRTDGSMDRVNVTDQGIVSAHDPTGRVAWCRRQEFGLLTAHKKLHRPRI